MPGKPLVADVMLEGREGLGIRTVDDFGFSWLRTVSRIVWPIRLAAELCGLGRQRLVVTHTCPRSYQGMRLPGPPNN